MEPDLSHENSQRWIIAGAKTKDGWDADANLKGVEGFPGSSDRALPDAKVPSCLHATASSPLVLP